MPHPALDCWPPWPALVILCRMPFLPSDFCIHSSFQVLLMCHVSGSFGWYGSFCFSHTPFGSGLIAAFCILILSGLSPFAPYDWIRVQSVLMTFLYTLCYFIAVFLKLQVKKESEEMFHGKVARLTYFIYGR